MLKYYLISLALVQSLALNLGQEEDIDVEDDEFDIPVCTDEDPAKWLPEESTGVENPEIEKECDSDDEEKGFKGCGCVPPRMVKWDTDENMKTSMDLLGDGPLANRGISTRDFHTVFNSREYQELTHDLKMKMMWD